MSGILSIAGPTLFKSFSRGEECGDGEGGFLLGGDGVIGRGGGGGGGGGVGACKNLMYPGMPLVSKFGVLIMGDLSGLTLIGCNGQLPFDFCSE